MLPRYRILCQKWMRRTSGRNRLWCRCVRYGYFLFIRCLTHWFLGGTLISLFPRTNITDLLHEYFLWNCSQVNFTNSFDEKSTLVQAMAWFRQATSHYLSQCWLRSLSSYGVTRLQWVYATIIQRALPTPGAHWIKLSPACISNLMPSKVWDEITNPFPNFQLLHRWRFGMDK